ncbi:MAG: flagellar biosynthesis anti-sigma factor FlgM [Bacillota bacterium]
MKINANPSIQKAMGIYNKTVKGVGKTDKVVQEKDKVEISEFAKEYQIAMSAYKKLPSVRSEKVEEISKNIQSGNYNPSAEEVVESMFDKKV